MTEDEWYETYKPIKNHIDSTSSWNNHMFETYGDALDFVNRQLNENIWTWSDGDDGGTYLSSGQSYVNRLGYFVCTVPWTEEAISITIDEPEECCDECGENLEEGDCECEPDVETIAGDLGHWSLTLIMPRNNGRITMETMPEKINVIRCITYDVPAVIKDLEEMDVDPIDLDTIIHYIAEWVEEYMRAPISRHDITYQDENGEEL